MKKSVLYILCLIPLFCSATYGIAAIPDTIKIGNTATMGNGGHIMTDQTAAIVITPANYQLQSMRIYFSSISKVDSLRFLVKSNPSYSCSGIGGMSNPFNNDQYTLGFSQNSMVSANSWNEFSFDPPINVSDTIYVWPDLLQQIQPRIEFAASGSEDSLRYANCVFSSTGPNDYRCEFVFIEQPSCPNYINVVDDINSTTAADTISSTAIIGNMKNITYRAGVEVRLAYPFEVFSGAQLLIEILGCN